MTISTELVNTITEKGKVIYAIGWDSGAPGRGADAERVYEYQDKLYIYWSSGEVDGPFAKDSLREIIIREGLLTITDAVTGVSIIDFSEAEIVELALIQADAGHEFEINNETWQVNANLQLEKV